MPLPLSCLGCALDTGAGPGDAFWQNMGGIARFDGWPTSSSVLVTYPSVRDCACSSTPMHARRECSALAMRCDDRRRCPCGGGEVVV